LYPNASKVKFRIQNFANLYVPDVQLRSLDALPTAVGELVFKTIESVHFCEPADVPFTMRLQIVSLLENNTQILLMPNGWLSPLRACIA